MRVPGQSEPDDAAGDLPLGQRAGDRAGHGLGRFPAQDQHPERIAGAALGRHLHALPPVVPSVAGATRRGRIEQIPVRSSHGPRGHRPAPFPAGSAAGCRQDDGAGSPHPQGSSVQNIGRIATATGSPGRVGGPQLGRRLSLVRIPPQRLQSQREGIAPAVTGRSVAGSHHPDPVMQSSAVPGRPGRIAGSGVDPPRVRRQLQRDDQQRSVGAGAGGRAGPLRRRPDAGPARRSIGIGRSRRILRLALRQRQRTPQRGGLPPVLRLARRRLRRPADAGGSGAAGPRRRLQQRSHPNPRVPPRYGRSQDQSH